MDELQLLFSYKNASFFRIFKKCVEKRYFNTNIHKSKFVTKNVKTTDRKQLMSIKITSCNYIPQSLYHIT